MDFLHRFTDFCAAAARFLAPYQVYTPVFTPINEISFFTWALTATSLFGDRYRACDPTAIKEAFVDASLAGADAIRSVMPSAHMLFTDPLCYVAAPISDPSLTAHAEAESNAQYEAWSRLTAGSKKLDSPSSGVLIGAHYYPANQWEVGSKRCLEWSRNDPQRRRLSTMLGELGREHLDPLVLSETSHAGAERGRWIREIAIEVNQAIEQGVDVRGICIYPVLDRPDWNDAKEWHRSGLWDVTRQYKRGKPVLRRSLDRLYARSLEYAQRVLPPYADFSWTRKEFNMLPIVVYSHLRWGFVYQRPQHLMSRFATHAPVIFVEEPTFDAGDPWLAEANPAPNVRVVTPHTPLRTPGFNEAQCRLLQPMIEALLAMEGCELSIRWLYTPMAVDMVPLKTAALIVYDCMDELSAFKGAPTEMAQNEQRLFAIADLVFTGGPSLYRHKSPHHKNLHSFPSSVDHVHFASAVDPKLDTAAQSGIPHPRIGFFGVLDERLDICLLAEAASERPDWHFVLVGPVVKICPETLPRAPNLHYFDQQPYDVLPTFVAGWDICMLPFAVNEATRFISPTKTLEYLAAGKPVVSTPIADVIDLYGSAVSIVSGAAEFIGICARLLEEKSPQYQAARTLVAQALLEKTSWDKTIADMGRLMGSVMDEAPAHSKGEVYVPAKSHLYALSRDTVPRHSPALIIGAGPTGLSCAYQLGAQSLIVESNTRIGGWCRSECVNGFTFDYAGHIMFSNDPYVHDLYRMLLGNNVHWQNREAWIFSNNVHTRYPFQGSLYGLPAPVLQECLMGAIEAHIEGRLRGDGGRLSDADESFEDFIYRTWGRGVAKHFAIPYNRKLWTVPLAEMETSWLGGRVPLPNLEQMIAGSLQSSTPPQGPNARFGYPLKGGFQALIDGFVPHLAGDLLLNAKVEEILPSKHQVRLADRRRLTYEFLVSTMPLPELIRCMKGYVPADVRDAAARLKSISVRCVHLGIGRGNLSDKHWIYYPEDTVFHRIFLQGNASPWCGPPGGFGLTCEITYSAAKPLPATGTALIQQCIDDCVKVGMIRRDDPIWAAFEVDLPYAYVIYDRERRTAVEHIRTWLKDHDIILAGRYSEWEYYNSDHAFVAGKRAAETVKEMLETGATAARETRMPRITQTESKRA